MDKAEEAKRQAAITAGKVKSALDSVNQILFDLGKFFTLCECDYESV